MGSTLTDQDKYFLDLTVKSAKKAYTIGNFPIGAVLVIDDKLIGTRENKINEKKSYFEHAEISLISDHATELYEAHQANQNSTLYSTLEPCLQCLGVSVLSYVTKIIYITKDPRGGACDMGHNNIGDFYQEWWPEIIHAPISNIPLNLMMQFFKDEVQKGNTQWAQHMIELFEKQ